MGYLKAAKVLKLRQRDVERIVMAADVRNVLRHNRTRDKLLKATKLCPV